MIPQASPLSDYSGWYPVEETASYYATDTPALGYITMPGNVVSKYECGMKLGFQQVQPLTAYWDFHTGVNSLVGSYTCTGSNITYTTGLYGRNALSFDGTDRRLTINNNANLTPTGDFTLRFGLMYGTGATIRSIYQSCLYTTSGTTVCAGFHVFVHTDNKVTVNIGNGTNLIQIKTTNTYGDNVFRIFYVVFRRGKLYIYVNGELEVNYLYNMPINSHAAPIRIGYYHDVAAVPAGFFNGRIWDVAFINGIGLDQKTVKKQSLALAQLGAYDLTLDKYAIIVLDPEYVSASNITKFTLYMGTDYTLKNDTISKLKVSPHKSPLGFPTSPSKWTETYYFNTNMTKTVASQVLNTWYSVNSVDYMIPGTWDVTFTVPSWWIYNSTAVAGAYAGEVTLGVAEFAESYPEFTIRMQYNSLPASSAMALSGMSKRRVYTATKVTLWLLVRSTVNVVEITLAATNKRITVEMQCALL